MRFALFALVAAAACSEITSPAADLSVSTRVSSTELRASDAITVTVTVTNQGGRAREINASSCPDPFVVTTEAGAVVTSAGQLCTADYRTKMLSAGESFSYSVLWRGEGLSDGAGGQPQRLPEGRYLLRGRVPAVDGSVMGDVVAVRILP